MIGGAFMEGSNININIINNNTNTNNNSRGNHHHPNPSPFLPEPDETRACDICGKTFSGVNQKFLLRRHRLTHTGERKFSCHLCPYQANQSGNLRRHLRFVHQTTELEGGQITAKPAACDLSAKFALMSKPHRSRQVGQLGDGSMPAHQALPTQPTNLTMQHLMPSKVQQEQVSRLAAHADHLRLLHQSSVHTMAAAHDSRLLLSSPHATHKIAESDKTLKETSSSSLFEPRETEVSKRSTETSKTKLSFSTQLFADKERSLDKDGPDEGSNSSVDGSIICLDSSPALPSSATQVKPEQNNEEESHEE